MALVMTVAMLVSLFAFLGPVASAAEEEEETTETTAETTAATVDDLGPTSYTDLDEVTDHAFEQAIQLFSKMWVLRGYTDGSFQPGGLLTRAEGAAIIARTLISYDVAENLSTNSGPFGDVPATHWGAGAISYAQNRGLITGVGGGMFDPGANLTKTQWLKILLCALGYGANHEFEGAGWASRVFEVATNPDVDLFGRYDLYWFDLNNIELHTIKISEDGLNEPITREEAVAFLYNAVVLTRKVVYDWHAEIYTPVAKDGATAALTGSDWGFLRDDIALVPWPNENRDNYGRPHDWSIYWGYRNEWIYNEPSDKTPTLLQTYKGSQTGNQLRTALQGILGNLSDLQMTKKVTLFTNGYWNQDWYVLATPSSMTNTRPLYRTDPSAADLTNGVYVPFGSSWFVLQNFLALRGNNAAFGAAVTIEVYEYKKAKEEDKQIDIVIKAPYLTQLTRKVPDDAATILIDETGIDFQVYNTADGTQMIEIEKYARGITGLANFKELYDNQPTGSYWFSTPYCYLTPDLDKVDKDLPDGLIFNWGGSLTPITDKTTIKPDKPDDSKPAKPHLNLTGNIFMKNEELRPINEVYEPAKSIVGVASASSPTRITVAGTAYNRALISPTIIDGDFTNNYTYYLDEDNVVLGAVYTAPGTPNMGGFLYLTEAQGSMASASSLRSTAWASAKVWIGTGKATTIPLLVNNNNQFWNPMAPGSPLSGAYDSALQVGGWSESGNNLLNTTNLEEGFYAYTIVDGQYRLTRLPAQVRPLHNVQTLPVDTTYPNGTGHSSNPVSGVDSPYILRGSNYVGRYEYNTTYNDLRVTATNRTILTVVDKNGVRYFTGFDNFPREILDACYKEDALFNLDFRGHALVRFEPGNGPDSGRNVAAEILYINTGDLEIGPPTVYAYYVEDTKEVTSTGDTVATFVGHDGVLYERIIITNPDRVSIDPTNPDRTRFYVLQQDVSTGAWKANRVWAGGSDPIEWPATVTYTAYLDGGYYAETSAGGFALSNTVATKRTDSWHTYSETQTGIVVVPWNYASELDYLGTNSAISTIDPAMLIITIEAHGDAQVAFGIKTDIGRWSLAGFQR